MNSEIIFKYFSALSEEQVKQIDALSELYQYWNSRINVISRNDMTQLYEHHVLHSLSIAKFINFAPGTKVLDAGTGGGFPGIPLAIIFPQAHFHLADSIGKKIKVVNEIAQSLKLKNISTQAERLEKVDIKVDFVVSRALARFPQIVKWVEKNIRKEKINSVSNGIIYLKGDDIEDEIEQYGARLTIIPIESNFKEDYFKLKNLLYLKV